MTAKISSGDFSAESQLSVTISVSLSRRH